MYLRRGWIYRREGAKKNSEIYLFVYDNYTLQNVAAAACCPREFQLCARWARSNSEIHPANLSSLITSPTHAVKIEAE